MNAILAQNVRIIREAKHWTQIHLAETAGIDLRTVQRVEKGDGASLKSAYIHVERLNELGMVVCVGAIDRFRQTRTGPAPWRMFVLVAWPKGEEKTTVAIPRRW